MPEDEKTIGTDTVKETEKDQQALQLNQLETEIKRRKYRGKFRSILKNTLGTLLVVAAIAVLVASVVMPVFQIYGTSMTPTLSEKEIVVALKNGKFNTGDVVALYYGSKLLVKRVIAGPGKWVNISPEGDVYVDNVLIEEPYVSEKSLEECTIDLPYQVPDGKYFVMGDHRSTSADSRNASVGAIQADQIVGKILFRVWPLKSFGKVQ